MPDATSKGTRPARAGGLAPARRHHGRDVSESTERRTNHVLRRRIDQLLGRVRAARAEIVERGLSAVHETPPAGEQRDGDGDGERVAADAHEQRPQRP
jgi:hypothetical protein